MGQRQAQEGAPESEVCHKIGISEHTKYRRKRNFHGTGVVEARGLRILEEENHKLGQLLAALSLDWQMLHAP